ncbi:hypothetical protein BJ166DRAFT_93036 [Pestalotiopsis sp. NC0098]|nr:hypothetical protein BJ166DRAFT_93036 [Pestalotiopsis sp. NC0098]
MSYRVGGGRSDVAERDNRYYYDEPRRGPPPRREYDDVEIFERREERERRSPPRRAPVREYEETDISIRERDSRTPAFLREERPREAGPLVLRSREIETIDRRRPRSPSPVRTEERIMVRRRSVSPPRRERSPPPAPMPELRRPRFMERSPSPEVRVESREIVRVDRRQRERSPTPEREQEIRIIQRERQRVPSPSPSPSPPPPPPPPQVIRGPTIEREVITHYRDIDHGVERVPAPSPPRPPPAPIQPRRERARESETDIEIYTSRHDTEVDIHRHSRSRSRPRPRPVAPPRGPSFYDDEVIVRSDRDRLEIDIEHDHKRSRSVAPPRPDYSDEADYITGKIDSRGRMGEAWNGATKDWTIVDVPPGTDRVKMDGVGGGSAEVTWQRYNGVRRAKFIPERDAPGPAPMPIAPAASSTSVSETVSDRDRLSVQIYDKHRDSSRDRPPIVEDVHDTRISIRDRDRDRGRRPLRKQRDMWTEITKDLVVREAIERLGYEYEETEYFFYVMEYLKYEDVLEIVTLSDKIRKQRKERAREIEWEREARERWERKHRHHHKHRDWDDERVVEREVIYEHERKPVRGYLH